MVLKLQTMVTKLRYAALALVLFCLTGNAWGATVVFGPENFGTGTSVPTGWTASGASWTISTASASATYTGASGGSNATINLGGLTSHFLSTPTIDFSSYNSGTLYFGVRCSSASFTADLTIEASIDNGSTWTAFTGSVTNANIPNSGWTAASLQTISLGSSINGKSQVKIRFRSGGGSGTSNLRIDDVRLEGTLASNVNISSPSQVAAQYIYKNTTANVISAIQVANTTGSSINLTAASFTTGGTYTTSEIATNGFKLYYTTTNTFATTTQLGSSASSTTGFGETKSFSFTQALANNATGYLWLTADIASGATAAKTISVNATAVADITVSAGTKGTTATAGGTQTISALPTINVTSPSSSSSTCKGATLSVAYTSSGNFNSGNTFTAQLSDASGSFASPIATASGASPISLTVPAGATTGASYKIQVVASNPSGAVSNTITSISVNAAPTLATIANICQGNSITLASGTAFTPSSGSSTITVASTSPVVSTTAWVAFNSPDYAITPTSTFTGTVTVQNAFSGCTVQQTFTVNANPTNSTTTTAICNGGLTLTTKALSGTGGDTWAIQSGGGALSSTTSTAGTYTPASTGSKTIRYSLASTGCFADATFTVNTAPTISPAAPNVCPGSTTAITVTNAGAGSFGALSGAGATSTTALNFVSTGSYNLVAAATSAGAVNSTFTVNGCSNSLGATIYTPVTFNPTTPSVCGSGSASFTASAAGSFSGVSSPLTVTGSSSPYTLNGNSAATGTGYSATYTTTTGSCASTVNLTVTSPPATPTISSPATVCASSTGNTFSVSNSAAYTSPSYAWTVSGTGWSGTSSTSSISVTAGAAGNSGTVSCIVTDGGCSSASGSSGSIASTAVSATPAITGTYCNGGTTISGTGVTGATISVIRSGSSIGSATVAGGVWTATVSTLAAADVITATQTESGKCVSAASGSVSVQSVSATPTISSTICAGTTVTGTGVTGATISVIRSGSSIGSATVAAGTWSATVSAIAGGDGITATQTESGKCVSVASSSVTVQSVSATPAITGTYCNGGTTVSGTGVNGATISVIRSGSSIGSATVAGGVWTATVSALAAANSITATQTESGKCVSAASGAVTVQSVSATPAITGTYCNGGTTISGTGVTGATISVIRSGSSIGSATVAAGVWTATVSTLAAADVITATQTESGKCVSAASGSVTVQSVSATPTISSTICAGTTVTGTGVTGATISVIRSGSSIGSATVAAGTWSATVSAIAGGDVLTATQTESGKCVSTASSSVTVLSGAGTPVANSNTTPQTSNVNSTDFTANWAAVSGATSYAIDVSTSSTFSTSAAAITEGFESVTFPPIGWAATGWSRSTTAGDINTGSAAAVGNSNNGTLTTIAVANPTNMTFYLGRSSSSVAKTLNINVCTTSQTGTFTTVATYDHSNVAASSYSQYTVDLSAYSSFSTVYIQFEKVSGTTSPWRLDDVVINASTPSYVNGYSNLNVGNVTSQLVNSNITAGGTYYYRVRAINSCGAGANSNVVSLTTRSLTASTLSTFGTRCMGSSTDLSFNLTGNNLTGGNITIGPLTGFQFSANGGAFGTTATYSGGTSFTNTPITVRFLPTGSGLISFDGNIPVSGGGATAINVAVTASGTTAPATPTITAGSLVPCPSTASTYSVTNVSGVSYAWSLPTNWTGTSITNSISAIASSVQGSTGTISVTPSIGTCAGSPATWSETVTTVAQPSTITPPATPCANSTGNVYSVTNVPGVTYTWAVNGTGWSIPSASTTNSVTVTAGTAAGGITVTPSVNGCTAATRTLTGIAVNSSFTPTVTIANSSTYVCTNSSNTFTATRTDANGGTPSYVWKVNGLQVATGTTTYSPAAGTLANGDAVTAEMTIAGASCAVPATVSSNILTAQKLAYTPVQDWLEDLSSGASYTYIQSGSTFYQSAANSGFSFTGTNSIVSLSTANTPPSASGYAVFFGGSGGTGNNFSISGINTTNSFPNKLTFSLYVDNTVAISTFVVEYSTDGGATYRQLDFGAGSRTGASSWTSETINSALPKSSNLTLRFTSNNSGSRNSRITNIKLQKYTVGDPSVTSNPTTPSYCSATNSTTLTAGPTGTPALTYAWSSSPASPTFLSSTAVYNPTATNVTATRTYTVGITDGFGCSATASKTVTINTPPTPSVSASGATTFCNGGSVTLTASGAGAGGSYSWSNGAAVASSGSLIDPGAYQVTLTDANTCTASTSTTVTVNPKATVQLGSSVLLTQGFASTLPTGWSITSTSGASYNSTLDNGATTVSTGYAGASGGYNVLTTQAVGASSSTISQLISESINITGYTNFSVSWGARKTASYPGNGTFYYSTDGGSNWNQVLFTDVAANATWALVNGGVAVNLPALGSATTLKLRWDAQATGNTSNYRIDDIKVTALADVSACNYVTSVSIPYAASANSTGYTLTSSLTNFVTQNGTLATGGGNLSITIPASTAAGSYNFSLALTNANSCSSTYTIPVTLNSTAAGITAGGATTFCAGGNVTLTATGGGTYAWSNSSAVALSGSLTTGGTYTVTVTGTNGCTATASSVVTVNTLPTAGITGTTTGCGSVSLTASGGNTYAWSGGSSTSNSTNTFSSSGTYTVTVTSAQNCSASTSSAVTVNTIPTSGITGTTTGCGSVSLTATGGNTYTWSGGSSTSTAANTFSTSNTYAVTVTGTNGCTATASSVVTVNTIPTAGITGTTTGCNPVSLTATGGASYSWSGGSSTGTAANTFSSSNTYSVTVTGANGCTATSSAAVTINPTIVPSVALADNTGGAAVCDAVNITYTATPTNGGSNPLYEFFINNVSQGAASASNTLVTSAVNNGDAVKVVLTSNASPCLSPTTATSNIITASITACGYVWTGNANTHNWNTTGNWLSGVPPSAAGSHVTIQAANTVNYPQLPSNYILGDVTMTDNNTIDLNGFNLDVRGNWQGGSTASYVTGAGSVIMSGTTSKTISGKTKFSKLTVNKTGGAGVTNSGTTELTTAFVMQSGTVSNTGAVVLKSDASGTAYFDNFTYNQPGSNYSGSLTVERYVGTAGVHYLGYPFNSHPLTGSGTAGRIIPQPTCWWAGTDASSPYSTIMTWDETTNFSNSFSTSTGKCSQQGWVAITNGTSAPGKGYAVNTSGTLSMSSTSPKLDNFNYAVTNSGFNVSNPGTSMYGGTYNPQYNTILGGVNLVSNPFPSPYMWDGGDGAGGTIADVAYVWQTSGSFMGSYQTVAVGDVIAGGQGFFVKATGNTSVVFSNANRRGVTTPTFYQSNNGNNLDIKVTGNGYADRTRIMFNDQSTVGFDNMFDGFKMMSSHDQPTLYTVMGGDMMASINTLPSIDQSPNVTMGLFAGTAGNFQLTFDNINSFDPTTYIYLEDKKTNTMQDMRANNTYSFASELSDSTDRFVVHFTPAVEINATDATCSTSGIININQPGTANWAYTVTDNNNATISSGTLSQNSPVVVNAAAGTYTLTLVDANNYTVMKTVTVNGTTSLTAAFASANNTTTNVDVAFNSTTADATNYYWDFGDGSTGSGQNAIHNYADTGTYTVTLIVVSASGCTSTTTHTITVTENATTGINNISNNKPVNIWSSDNRVFIDFSKQTKVEATIEFYNVLGQELSQEKFGRSTIFIKELSNIEAAYVIVKVKNEDVITTKKVFVASK